MSSIKTTQVDGDVSVGRDVAIGGMITAQGSVQFKGRVRVDGWLDAPNIKGVNKGLFESVEVLNEYYPRPHNGWWAMILTSGSDSEVLGDIYIGVAGEWKATGKTAQIDIEYTAIEDRMDSLSSDIIKAQEAADDAEATAEAAQETADEAQKSADKAQETADEALAVNEETKKELDDTTAQIKAELVETPQYNLIKDGNFSKYIRSIYDWQSSLKDAVAIKDKRFGWCMYSPKEAGGIAANGSKSILAEGQRYTLSFYAWGKGVAGLQVRQGLNEVIAQDFVGTDIDNSKEAQRTVVTFTATALSYLQFYKEIEGELWLAHVKLEEGDRATQWMPHRSEVDLATPIIADTAISTANDAYDKAEQALANSEEALTAVEEALEIAGGNDHLYVMTGVAESKEALAETNPEAGGIYWVEEEGEFMYVMSDGNIVSYEPYNKILKDGLFRCGDDLYHYNEENGDLAKYVDTTDLAKVQNNIMEEVNNAQESADNAQATADQALALAKGLIYYEEIE